MPELQEAARRFFREPYNFFASGSSSGFSGSAFACVEARGKSWCLRRWPSSFEKRRLRFIHRVLLHSRANGFAGVPALATTDEGETVLDLGGRFFDAQEWLTGEPLSGRPVWDEPMPNVVRPLEPRTLASLAAAVARFHRSTARLTPERENEVEPLSTHLAGLIGEAETNHEALLADVGDRAKGDERRVALRWLELLPEATALAGATSRDYPTGARASSRDQPAHAARAAGADPRGDLERSRRLSSLPLRCPCAALRRTS